MSFDQIVVRSSAPTFCNIKPGNMFFIKSGSFAQDKLDEWIKSFDRHGIMTFVSPRQDLSTVVLVLNIRWAEKILGDLRVKTYLEKKGYRSGGVFYFVNELFRRMKKSKAFPHEVGIILGYPVEDVIEFEKKHGSGCKYCGSWKTYSDVENAKECQCRYRVCSGMCRQLYEEGYTLSQIIKEYEKFASAA